jgi:hypothetical protein
MLTDAHCRAAKPKAKLYRINNARGLYLEVIGTVDFHGPR